MSQEQVKSATHKVLSKYTTVQLISKLEANTLIGLSKTTAVEILKKRGEKDTTAKEAAEKFGGDTWVKEKPKPLEKKVVSKPEEKAKEQPIKVEKESKKQVVEKKVKEKPVAKVKVVKEKSSKKKSFESIDETDKKVSEIITSAEFNKSQKIAKLLELGYSVRQVAESSLQAHKSFVNTIRVRLAEEKA